MTDSTSHKMKKFRKNAVARVKQTTQEFDFSLHRLIPNFVTVGAICMGLSAIRFALMDKMSMALLAILFAAILDSIGGSLARFLKVESAFGAQFDSLSDFASFGVAPALITYISILKHNESGGWILCLFFVLCQALRLARYNTQTQESKRFFVGVPAPMGALIGLYPHIIGFTLNQIFSSFVHGCFLVLAGCLMASRLPTYSLKAIKMNRFIIRPFLIGVGLTIAALVSDTWMTLTLFVMLYICSLPFSWFAAKKQRNRTTLE